MSANLQCPICSTQHVRVVNWCTQCGAVFAKVKTSPLKVFGVTSATFGVLLTAYYWLVFNIGYGGVVNVGLVSDRTNGLIVGVAMTVLGSALLVAFVFAPKGINPMDLVARLIAPPPKIPAGFKVPLTSVRKLTSPPSSLASLSYPIWTQQLNAALVRATYTCSITEKERKWAYEWGIAPTDVASFFAFIDKFHAYHGRRITRPII